MSASHWRVEQCRGPRRSQGAFCDPVPQTRHLRRTRLSNSRARAPSLPAPARPRARRWRRRCVHNAKLPPALAYITPRKRERGRTRARARAAPGDGAREPLTAPLAPGRRRRARAPSLPPSAPHAQPVPAQSRGRRERPRGVPAQKTLCTPRKSTYRCAEPPWIQTSQGGEKD